MDVYGLRSKCPDKGLGALPVDGVMIKEEMRKRFSCIIIIFLIIKNVIRIGWINQYNETLYNSTITTSKTVQNGRIYRNVYITLHNHASLIRFDEKKM
jgi:hypothetical protein